MSLGLREAAAAIRERVSLAEVLERHTRLKPAGAGKLKGLCPFHPEKTPSFSVDVNKGMYYCFGCKAGGDLFTALERLEGLPFAEAVEEYARRLGLPFERSQRPEVPGLLEALKAAAEAFRADYHNHIEGLDYLASRGISEEVAERFGIGYHAPDTLRKLPKALNQGLVEAGLLKRRPDGSLYAPLKGRVIFPVRSVSGNVVAFSGRLLAGEGPKYLHTAESAVWRKSQVLYGLYEGKELIRRQGFAVVVEGQFDVLKLQQMGLPGVASLGSSLAAEQIAALRRVGAETVYLGYDRDEAGLKATLAALADLRGQVGVRVVVWPLKDAGECSPEMVEDALAQALSPAEFLLAYAESRFAELDRRLGFLQPWLSAQSLTDSIPHELAALLRQRGVEVGEGMALRRVRQPEERQAVASEKVRLLEADLIALLVGVRGDERRQLVELVQVEAAPEPGGLLAPFLDALEAGDDPQETLRALGGGDVLYMRLAQAPTLSLEEARPKAKALCRQLFLALLERQRDELKRRLAEAADPALIEEYAQLSAAIDAERRRGQVAYA